ncbi:MAG: hypothetical protein HQL35_09645 [Alphaproteobacteria bacterium]|nr:hypothetical protein [Alphaproteobacteria bacterium]
MPVRQYQRGKNRYKHVGKENVPKVEKAQNGEVVGKCPASMSEEHKSELLVQAIPYITEPPYSADFPKRLFVVDQDGTIYTGQTTEPGKSYHGYPYAGPIGRRLKEALRKMARKKGCEGEFNQWIKRYIKDAGRPDI